MDCSRFLSCFSVVEEDRPSMDTVVGGSSGTFPLCLVAIIRPPRATPPRPPRPGITTWERERERERERTDSDATRDRNQLSWASAQAECIKVIKDISLRCFLMSLSFLTSNRSNIHIPAGMSAEINFLHQYECWIWAHLDLQCLRRSQGQLIDVQFEPKLDFPFVEELPDPRQST